MTDDIGQFFPGRLLPPRQALQLIDDTHESTHQRSSAPFWKAKKLRYTNSTLDRRRGLPLSIARPGVSRLSFFAGGRIRRGGLPALPNFSLSAFCRAVALRDRKSVV